MTTPAHEAVVMEVLGFMGRMLSGSKSEYLDRHPTNNILFNANIFSGTTARKIWFGDLDLTLDKQKLLKLAATLNEVIYVTSETPFRFEPPTVESLEKDIRNHNHAVYCFAPGQKP